MSLEFRVGARQCVAPTGVQNNFVMTYSIVAYDREQNQLGVAVQSHSLCVGSVVPWAEAGVGALATQARSNRSSGHLGLTMMRERLTAQQTLKALLISDRQPEIRQLAIVDKQGNIAVHTGDKCVEAAGHRQGKCYSVQANLMLKNTVWDAMAEAFETSSGDLAQRMMKALFAAQAEGGDLRGQQSAALLVVSSQYSDKIINKQLFNLRIDDSKEPLKDLESLLKKAKIRLHRQTAVNLLLDSSANEGKFKLAAEKFRREELIPNIANNPEDMFWYAITLASVGRVEDAQPIMKELFTVNPNWKELIPRLIKVGLVSDKEGAIAQLLE